MATVRSWALSVLFLALPVAPACKSPPAAQPANVDRCTSEPVLSRDLATPGNTLILGETHGTREVPIFAADLACHALAQGRTLVLALEIPARSLRAIAGVSFAVINELSRPRVRGRLRFAGRFS
ncbi:hypothetical protein [Nannocystis radixulma]|nr:hypothetical protein [Nannocystis radixulma]